MPQTSSSKFRASAADKQRHPSLERRCEDEQGESSQHLQPTHPSTQDPPRATGPVLRPTDLSRVNMRRHRTMDTTKNSDHLQHQHHEVPSEEHGLYDRRNEQDFNNSIEQENIQHSPRPAQDQQNESSELGWTIYEDPPDDPQPTSKTDRAFAEHKNHIRDPCESIATTSSSVPTMDARQQLLQRGKSMTQQRKQAQNQLSQTQQVQLELQEREKQMELEREDLDRRLKEQEQRRLEYESLREKLRIQQMKEAEGERQARAQDMSPRKRRRSEEDETGDGMARTRVDPHHSRQPQATNRPAQRRTHAPTRPQQQHHPQERVHVPAHQEHPQGEASESPRKRPREAEDEVSEEKVSRVRVDPHADDRVSSVAASSSNQPRQQHQHMQQRSETRPLQARRLPDQHAKQHHQAQSQREEPQRQVHPQASRQASQQASQQPPQQAVQQREPTAQELEELRKKRYRGFYAKCEKYYIYGEIYRDTTYEFRQVTLPKQMLRDIQPEFKLHPSTHLQTLKLLTEAEWRFLYVRMSEGWENYARHDPEPHILMFRRTHAAANRAKIAAAQRKQEERRREAALMKAKVKEEKEEEVTVKLEGVPEEDEEAQKEEVFDKDADDDGEEVEDDGDEVEDGGEGVEDDDEWEDEDEATTNQQP